MTWEALTAVASAITTVVLVATVIMAGHQVRLLRRSTQLDGLMRVLDEMDDPVQAASYRFVLDEFPAKMREPVFRQRVIEGQTDASVHRYLPALWFYEKVGSLVKFGLIDPDAVYCQAGARAVKVWNALQEVIASDRARGGPGVWDGFEVLANGATRYYRRMNPNFPGPYQPPDSSKDSANVARRGSSQ